MAFCGIDLAVKRETDVGLMIGNSVKVYEVMTDEEIVSICMNAKASALDSPFNYYYREIDREMLKHGYKVLPPSFMKSLVERAMRLRNSLKLVETHPTSSLKNAGIDWRSLSRKKDVIDAVISALTARLYYEGKAQVIYAHDGIIALAPKSKVSIIPLSDFDFIVFP
ncbi:DUF429 domain-containing protein [Sulfuracidifex tepidarius]|uniref:DUF429 domain-containing protein n=1 Tax=Sulfuracidifex tepidarius TaxID=1294262 RepID=A0A510DRI3_9CREN|nr:hypothetical protein [Sulfuracidifex tepidarius]BBG22791.1 hypothetical protein IC006_0075 [Sulfuracidifex tepidarius]BBG25568.1 hypothetical protein IC007_0073 [Sulfuracidifex tepidarius]